MVRVVGMSEESLCNTFFQLLRSCCLRKVLLWENQSFLLLFIILKNLVCKV